MAILKETQYLTEVLLPAKKSHIQVLKYQMAKNEELAHTLTAPIGTLPKYQFLIDTSNVFHSKLSLLKVIEITLQLPDMEAYFMKTSKGLFVGFIAISIKSENRKTVVNDVKVFSFGLSPKEDEDVIRKDVPALLDTCLKKYSKVSWTALKGNKANIAYEIYCKKHKGQKEDIGNSWRYTCYQG